MYIPVKLKGKQPEKLTAEIIAQRKNEKKYNLSGPTSGKVKKSNRVENKAVSMVADDTAQWTFRSVS